MGDPQGYLEMKVEEIENGEFRGKTLEVPEAMGTMNTTTTKPGPL